MKFITIFITLFCFFLTNTFAQFEKQIDSLFADYNDQPGCAVAVYKDGKVSFSKGYGYANLDYDIKNTPITVFDIGSISKQFTAACMVLLANDGKIKLEDPVRKYIPELPKYSDTVITIKHLIYHTSGIRSFPTLQVISGIPFENVCDNEMNLDLICRQKALNFNPGEEFLYNNSGYLLLAIITERVTGKTLGEFAKERIFEPLGMNSTFFYEDTKRIIKNRAIGYIKKDSMNFERLHMFEYAIAGPGGLHTTVEDFQKWDENFYTEKIGGKEFYETMHTNGILNKGDTLDYAFGLMQGEYKGVKYVTHTGGWGAFSSIYIRFPEHHLSFTGFSNGGFSPAAQIFEMAELYLEKHLEKDDEENTEDVVKVENSVLQNYEGKYELSSPKLVIEASLKDDTLRMHQTWNNSKYAVVPTSDTTFVLEGVANLVFSFRDIKKRKAQTMHILQNGNHSDWYRMSEAPKNLKLNEYEGEYYSEELLCTYKFFVKDDTLNLKLNYLEPFPFEISKKDVFTTPRGTVTFIRSKDKKKIIGLIVDAGRAKGIRFEKK